MSFKSYRGFRVGLLAASALLILSVFSSAAIYKEEWETDDAGWQIKSKDEGAAYGSADWYSGSPWDGREEVLRIEASTGAGISQDIIYADPTADGTLVGNMDYSHAEYIQFDFYANMAPVQLNAYFKGNNVIWLNEITSVTVGSWDSYSITLGYDFGEGWRRQDGTPETSADFRTSVADVDEIGILIWYQGSTAGQDYGLDNYTVIPEPETYLMLGFALLSLAVTFRRQLNDALAGIKVRSRI